MKTYVELVDEAKRAIHEISPDDLVARQKSGERLLILDVREVEELEKGRIPGAINVPRGLLEMDVTDHAPDPNTPLVCHCGGGGRSALAAKTLQEMGYTNVMSLAGGFKAWVARGLPVQQ